MGHNNSSANSININYAILITLVLFSRFRLDKHKINFKHYRAHGATGEH